MKTPTVREWLTAHKDEYDDRESLIYACMEATGVENRKSVVKKLGPAGVSFGNTTQKAKHSMTKQVDGNSLDAFRQKYDNDTIVPAKIETALKKLGDAWVYETEFVKLSGVSQNHLANYRDAFADYWVITRGDKRRVWAGTTAFAQTLREYC